MIKQIVCDALDGFCHEFLENPYLCYTEHGLHARFYSALYPKIPRVHRYANVDGRQVCVLQKEYPTATDLGKSRRQTWDIAVLAQDRILKQGLPLKYDFLPLDCVVEFGLNYGRKHLVEDISRLGHDEASVENRFIAHFYRLSRPKFSRRDIGSDNSAVLEAADIQKELKGSKVEAYLTVADFPRTDKSGVWRITVDTIYPLR